MSKPPLRGSLIAAVLAAALASPAAPAPGDIQFDAFPKAGEVFPLLIADPRAVQLYASYYRRRGDDDSDVALGHSWGLARWRTGSEAAWLWEWDVEGMAYSRFKIGGGVNEFETADFLAGLPLTVRKGDVSFKGSLFHKSSLLSDDYAHRTGQTDFHYSTDGLRFQAALEPCRFARAYGGFSYLLYTAPSPRRWATQSGLEIFSGDLGWSKTSPTRLFLAQDLQWHERVKWNMDSHTVAGVKIGLHGSATRAVRVQAGYFAGHSPFGQFFAEREHHADFSLAFEF